MGKSLGSMSILEPKDIGNCSNNGLSSKYDRVLIWSEKDENAPDNAVVIIEDICCGEPRVRAVPANKKGWSMHGGCCIYTCNGVVPHNGVYIPLHDRFETAEESHFLSI